MIDIPIGKALTPVESKSCEGCWFESWMLLADKEKELSICRDFDCFNEDREDGKNVRFVIIDLPEAK